MLALDPQAARVCDEDTFLPLHLLCLSATYAAGALSDKRVYLEDGYTRCVARLLAEYPAAATTMTHEKWGKMTPLGLLTYEMSEESTEITAVYPRIVEHLVESAPSALSLANAQKKVPFARSH